MKSVETTIEAQMEDMPLPAYLGTRSQVVAKHREFLKGRGYNSDRMSDARIIRIAIKIADSFRPLVPTEDMLEDYLAAIASNSLPLSGRELSLINPEVLDRIVSIEDIMYSKSIGESRKSKSLIGAKS